jgi:hypothetical protein
MRLPAPHFECEYLHVCIDDASRVAYASPLSAASKASS